MAERDNQLREVLDGYAKFFRTRTWRCTIRHSRPLAGRLVCDRPAFKYDAKNNLVKCPGGKILTRRTEHKQAYLTAAVINLKRLVMYAGSLFDDFFRHLVNIWATVSNMIAWQMILENRTGKHIGKIGG